MSGWARPLSKSPDVVVEDLAVCEDRLSSLSDLDLERDLLGVLFFLGSPLAPCFPPPLGLAPPQARASFSFSSLFFLRRASFSFASFVFFS